MRWFCLPRHLPCPTVYGRHCFFCHYSFSVFMEDIALFATVAAHLSSDDIILFVTKSPLLFIRRHCFVCHDCWSAVHGRHCFHAMTAAQLFCGSFPQQILMMNFHGPRVCFGPRGFRFHSNWFVNRIFMFKYDYEKFNVNQ